ncbi:MAG: TMEM175 family protein [Planctomycetota bacterium]|nr:TMEM175 family protein [Planctomycetota bacterium]
MIREHLFHKRAAADPLFRWRGGDISRIEALSDGVFALTITLIVVSSSVPATTHELWLLVRDIPVFLVSFAMLLMAWHYHHMFFRRYGLEDFLTMVLNGAFLFLVLFFAYPLKFLGTYLWRLVLRDGEALSAMIVPPEGSTWTESELGTLMMVFYSVAIAGVFGVLALLVLRAWCKRDELELDRLERFLTLQSIGHHLLTVGVALASLGILAFGGQPSYSGIVYFLLGPLHAALGFGGAARSERLRQELVDA